MKLPEFLRNCFSNGRDTGTVAQACKLWESWDAGLIGPDSRLTIYAFLGAQYALMAASKRCELTSQGREVVQQAILEMQAIQDAESS